MSRVSYKMLVEWLNEWNEAHPELYMNVSVYNGYYHIGCVDDKGAVVDGIVVEATPGLAWESFCLWKKGFYTCQRMFEEGKYQILSAKGKITPMKNQ